MGRTACGIRRRAGAQADTRWQGRHATDRLYTLPSVPVCRETTRRLGLAWLLASACLLHHLTHWLGAAAPHWLHVLASTPVHAAMSALALLGACAAERPTADHAVHGVR